MRAFLFELGVECSEILLCFLQRLFALVQILVGGGELGAQLRRLIRECLDMLALIVEVGAQ